MEAAFIRNSEDTLKVLDSLLGDGAKWWGEFFQDRAKPCPFFVDWPDENLIDWLDSGVLRPGKAVELGSGHGRNSLELARRGFQIDGIDFSAEAVAWARERAVEAGVTVTYQQASIFTQGVMGTELDLVYDSGCFHHLAPHRRESYLDLVRDALKPGGHFGLVCFKPEGGSGLNDFEVYRNWSLGGGLGYSERQLRELWDSEFFEVLELRPMRQQIAADQLFGEEFLWVLLARKR